MPPSNPQPLLLIGAMKAGTTSLYDALAGRSDIAVLPDKEPNAFVSGPLDTEALHEYRRRFRAAEPDPAYQLDASTAYAKRPDHEHVAIHVERTFGSSAGVKVLYSVRAPIDRAISHYRHDVARGFVTKPIDEALVTEPRYVDWGRYGFQLAPWIERFGREAVHVTSLERMSGDMRTEWQAALRFLDLGSTERVDTLPAKNRSDGARPATGAWATIRDSAIYRSVVRPLLSPELRTTIRMRALPTKHTPDEISRSTRDFLDQAFAEDEHTLLRLLGTDQRPWELVR